MTGSTGHIGSQVIQYLAGEGAEVSALTRSPERARFPAGIGAVKGDISDIDTMRAAMKGVDTIFLLLPSDPGEQMHALQILRAARENGVKGFV